MDRWSGPLLGGRSRAELPGRVSKEAKGVCEVWGVGKGFIARAGLPYKEENAGSAVIGVQGLRVGSWLDGEGSVSAPDWTAWLSAHLRGLSAALCQDMSRHARACPGMPQHARPCTDLSVSSLGFLELKLLETTVYGFLCDYVFISLCKEAGTNYSKMIKKLLCIIYNLYWMCNLITQLCWKNFRFTEKLQR